MSSSASTTTADAATAAAAEVTVKHQPLEAVGAGGEESAGAAGMTYHLAGDRLALLPEGSMCDVEGVDVLVNFCTPHILSGRPSFHLSLPHPVNINNRLQELTPSSKKSTT